MVEVIGFFGVSIFLFSTVMQALRVISTKNAQSYGWPSLFLWLIGGAATFFYNYELQHGILLLTSGMGTFLSNFSILLTKFYSEIILKFFEHRAEKNNQKGAL